MRTILLPLLFAATLPAVAADVSVSGNVSVRQGGTDINIGFSNRDRAAITAYYRDPARRTTVQVSTGSAPPAGAATVVEDDDRGSKPKKHKHKDKDMPPGLAKRGDDLPPGLRKKKHLPPGLAKRDRMPDDVHYEPLPRELEVKLTPLPDKNFVRVRVGKDLVLFNTQTRVVFDIQRDLVR